MTSLSIARLRPLALLVTVLGLVVGLAPAQATPPPVISEMGRGSVWHAVKVTTDGQRVDLTLALRQVALPLQFGVRVWQDDRILSHSNVGVRGGGERGVLVHVKAAPGVAVGFDNLDRYNDVRFDEAAVNLTINPPGQQVVKGTVTVLFWGASRTVDNWGWNVRGEPGVVLGASTRGHGVHFYTSRDFDSGLVNVLAGHRDERGGRFARAQVGAAKSVLFKRMLIGDFFPDPGTASRLTVSTPRYSEACLPHCSYTRTRGDGVMGPGTYVFTIDGTGVGQSGNEAGEVVLSAVDVTLP